MVSDEEFYGLPFRRLHITG